MAVYEFLTLTEPEAMFLVDVFNGLAHTPGLARAELLMAVEDSMPGGNAPDLATKWGVNGKQLLVRLAHLNDDQSEAVLEAINAFWRANPTHSVPERLSSVGLV